MDLSRLLAAYLIAQGAHTGGHFYQGMNPNNPFRDTDAPMRLDIKNLEEKWAIADKGGGIMAQGYDPSKDPYAGIRVSREEYLADLNRQRADIHGAGFAMQDNIRNRIEDSELQSDVSIINAIIKGAYLAGIPMKLSKQINPDGGMQGAGDIGEMKKTSGNKHVDDLVLASALYDLYKSQNPGGRLSYGFDVIDGAPGGRVTYRW